jgi:hypothetical protein
MLAQYFDRTGRQLSREEACDADGILKDGIIARTRLTMRDGARDVPRFTNDDFQLHRPGFRSSSTCTPLSDGLARDAKAASYRDYNDYITQAYKKPVRADAAEQIEEDNADDDEIPADVMSRAATRNGQNDKRSISQRMKDHAERMNDIYAAVNRDLENEWRKR